VTKLIEQQLNSVASASSGALSVGLAAGVLVALWTASSGIFHLAEALNIAHDVSDDRPFWRKRGHAVALTLALLAVLGLITIVLSFSATAFSGPASVAVRIGGWLGAAVIGQLPRALRALPFVDQRAGPGLLVVITPPPQRRLV
jgi:uncharacterized BrkB/YihY/UPF0761 family membrane protein